MIYEHVESNMIPIHRYLTSTSTLRLNTPPLPDRLESPLSLVTDTHCRIDRLDFIAPGEAQRCKTEIAVIQIRRVSRELPEPTCERILRLLQKVFPCSVAVVQAAAVQHVERCARPEGVAGICHFVCAAVHACAVDKRLFVGGCRLRGEGGEFEGA